MTESLENRLINIGELSMAHESVSTLYEFWSHYKQRLNDEDRFDKLVTSCTYVTLQNITQALYAMGICREWHTFSGYIEGVVTFPAFPLSVYLADLKRII